MKTKSIFVCGTGIVCAGFEACAPAAGNPAVRSISVSGSERLIWCRISPIFTSAYTPKPRIGGRD
jgi:hypothetical protein